jgi:beta-galactosidase/beta-glucuronidase
MVRTDWKNLNGLWEYAITPRSDSKPDAWQGQILVPFPIESALSGVMQRLDANQRLWYRHSFAVPHQWSSRHVLLHFDAVDWETVVWINGKELPTHRGGYDDFVFDITDLLHQEGDQEVVVSVWDPTDGTQPHGKQTLKRGGMTYTSSSGIWQTVWIEPVSATRIDQIKIVPDVDNASARLTVKVTGDAQQATVEAVVRAGGKELSHTIGKAGSELVLPVHQPRLWSPDDPFLYDLRIVLHVAGSKVDNVESYFGLRKLALGKDSQGIMRILLNGKFVVQLGPLDQGFWPDGLYTAPCDEALRFDIEMTRKLGFNATRKHVKIEPQRWYYWCDRLGLMVWQDMPATWELGSGPERSDAVRQFKTELRRMIEARFNHPSIVMWIPFNEGWGIHNLQELTGLIRQLDPTRMINHESGEGGEEAQGIRNRWDAGLGDLVDTHSYGRVQALPPESNRAAVIGEFGGVPLRISEHTWGAGDAADKPLAGSELLTTEYIKQVHAYEALVEKPGVSGMIYTQLTDVENELNGLLTYDRLPKVNVQRTAAAHGEIILRRSRQIAK